MKTALKLHTSLRKVEKWVEDHDYRGYEPFDGLSSVLRPLTFGTDMGERLLQQLVRQCPLNLRPLIGVRPQESTKGRGYMAWGYLQMYRLTRDESYKQRAVACLEWLDKHKAPAYTHHAWGNHFDFTSRGGRLPRNEPIIVWSSLIGQTYLDAYELLGEKRYLEIANSICNWILALPRERTSSGACLSYIAPSQSSIHNSNMLGAAMLARASRLSRNAAAANVAAEAMLYSCSRQLGDGAWWYGEDPKFHWIDNFHTAYNLDSLKCYIDSTGDTTFADNLRRGFTFYKANFFEPTGRPRYYHNRTFPVDSQCISQSIDTLANFSDHDPASLGLGIKVANWAIDNMQDPRKGHFYFRQYPLIKAKTPMLHWAQATTYKALTLLYGKVVS